MKGMSFIRVVALLTAVGASVQPAFAESVINGVSAQSAPRAARLEVPAPRLPAAVNGQLDLKDLAGKDAQVEFAYPSIANGDTVGMRWSGSTVHNAKVQTVGASRPLVFIIPNAEVAKSKGTSAVLTASVGVGDNPLVISAPLSLKVVDSTPAPDPGELPAPGVPEAVNQELDAGRLGTNVVVAVAYPSLAKGHKVSVKWTGKTVFSTAVQTAKTTSPLKFNVPRATVVQDLNNSAVVTYTTVIPGAAPRESEPQSITVVLGDLPAPVLPEAVDGGLDVTTLGINTKATVSYPSFAAGQKVALHWKGVTAYDSPVQTTATTSPLTFNVSRATVAQDLNKTAELTYSLDITGLPTQHSDALAVRVVSSSPTLPPATLANLVDGVMDIGKFQGNLTATVTYPGINPGHKVFVRWKGITEYSSAVQTVSKETSLKFLIPTSALKADVNGSGKLEYIVDIDGAVQSVSEPLPISVIETVAPGEKVAQELNARYADTRMTCDDGKPAYYCNGIIIRSTENGNYDPWNPSPAAVKLGGVSFSYLRKDAYVGGLYHYSGFIFMPQSIATAQGKLVNYLCIYAYDAGTLVGTRGAQGCGLKPRSAIDADPSTCGNVGVRTVAQWYAYTKTIANRDYQCSLSTADATQFAASFQVRAKRPANMDALWNEMMVKTWPQNIPAQLPLESFFYTTATGRAEAKTYQTKYNARTGKWLPIVKLNLANLATNPFSYSASDQAIQP